MSGNWEGISNNNLLQKNFINFFLHRLFGHPVFHQRGWSSPKNENGCPPSYGQQKIKSTLSARNNKTDQLHTMKIVMRPKYHYFQNLTCAYGLKLLFGIRPIYKVSGGSSQLGGSSSCPFSIDSLFSPSVSKSISFIQPTVSSILKFSFHSSSSNCRSC